MLTSKAVIQQISQTFRFCPHPFFCLVQHVHGPLVDVPLQLGGGLLQLLQPLTSLTGVVDLKVIGSVGLAEELTLRVDPVMFLQHSRHLEGDSMTHVKRTLIILDEIKLSETSEIIED